MSFHRGCLCGLRPLNIRCWAFDLGFQTITEGCCLSRTPYPFLVWKFIRCIGEMHWRDALETTWLSAKYI